MEVKVVILAAGLGKRMRKAAADERLNERQRAVAETGVKALIPIERPFLDYVLTTVADAGYRQVCLVVGPQHEELRRYYSALSGGRLQFQFAVQPEPLGTAHAVASAADCVGDSPFLVLNSDNYYPLSALTALREVDGNALVGFERQSMVRGSNVSAERLSQFAVIEADSKGYLRRIIEKPPPEVLEQLPEPVLLSMNCWRFEPVMFDACRSIEKSPRGEYEIPDAVAYAMQRLDQPFRVMVSHEAVLDLSTRADVVSVAERLKGLEVRL
ncbi:MAG: nucleotidyltransferase family protein [Planctomycetes bacterium]|nr:nucleotidyltransferase family protein [Planctomycetota bacterium]